MFGSNKQRAAWTVGRKLTALIIIGVVVSYAAVILTQTTIIRSRQETFAAQNYVALTELLAGQIGGGLRFKKAASIEKAYAGLTGHDNSAVVAIAAFSKGGERIVAYEKDGDPPPAPTQLPEFAKKVFADGAVASQVSAFAQTVAVPVRYGKKDEIVGSLVVAWDIRRVSDAVAEATKKSIAMAVVVAMLLVASLSFFIGRVITRPIADITSAMRQLADGNTIVNIPAAERGDEIGDMADALLVFKENALEKEKLEHHQRDLSARTEAEKRQAMRDLADRFERNVGGILKDVTSASTELDATAQSMSQLAERSQERSDAVAMASEQASANVQTVASASEELSASIAEIARQVNDSTRITAEAVDKTERTNGSVVGLNEAAKKIGDVVELINDIASQTNLLALNATIEAARAGEAGKGFAVVASEVKNLANQTAGATGEIAGQIAAIQQETGDAVAALGEISQVIGKINDIVVSVASSVEEQAAATQEITRNVDEAAEGTQEVNRNIAAVSDAGKQTGTASGDVRDASQELSRNAEMLDEAVRSFLDDIRVA
jgi:methyl-accepting chemotaxis protein